MQLIKTTFSVHFYTVYTSLLAFLDSTSSLLSQVWNSVVKIWTPLIVHLKRQNILEGQWDMAPSGPFPTFRHLYEHFNSHGETFSEPEAMFYQTFRLWTKLQFYIKSVSTYSIHVHAWTTKPAIITWCVGKGEFVPFTALCYTHFPIHIWEDHRFLFEHIILRLKNKTKTLNRLM